MTITAICGQPIVLGRVGDNNVTTVVFDKSAWVAEYGPGSFFLTFKAPGSTTKLPVAVEAENGIVTWSITEAETAVRGTGEAQLAYIPDGKTKMSEIYDVIIGRSLASPENPQPIYQGFVDQVLQAAADAEQAKTDAETAQGLAESAKISAETAQEAAETAQGLAENAQEAAETAQGLAENARDAAQLAQDAAETSEENAEAWAVGQRNGSDVSTDDPAYQNNAKFYATQAGDSASDAQTARGMAEGSAQDAEAWAVGQRGGVDVTPGDDAYQNNAKYYASEAEDSAQAAQAAQDAAETAAEQTSEAVHFTDFDNNAVYSLAWGTQGGYPVLKLTEITEG